MPLFPAGHELGHFRIVGSLGSGGMADVYEAEDTTLGRRVALKVLPLEFSRTPDLVLRFEKEVRSAASLNHRSIVTVFEVGQQDNYNYYAMRLLTGGDLRKRIETGLSVFDALLILRELADAFVHAHGRGFVHRDVKPENIVFDEQGLPVLTDFGIAKALDASTKMTKTGVAVGTPRYISPEQARGKQVDARADIYSLGVIFYEMLTGKPPYDAEESLAVIFKHVTEPIPTLPEQHAVFQPLLESMMEKDPAKRIPSCEQLIAEIDKLLPQFAGDATTTTQGGKRTNPLMPRVRTPRQTHVPGGETTPAPVYRTGGQPTVVPTPTPSSAQTRITPPPAPTRVPAPPPEPPKASPPQQTDPGQFFPQRGAAAASKPAVSDDDAAVARARKRAAMQAQLLSRPVVAATAIIAVVAVAGPLAYKLVREVPDAPPETPAGLKLEPAIEVPPELPAAREPPATKDLDDARKAEKLRRQKEAEARRRAEEKRQEEEAARLRAQQEAARTKAEEERKAAEAEEKRKAEAAARLKAEDDKRKEAEEAAARQKAQEDKRKEAEAAARKEAEDKKRREAEAAARRKAEEEKRKEAEAAARKKAEEEEAARLESQAEEARRRTEERNAQRNEQETETLEEKKAKERANRPVGF